MQMNKLLHFKVCHVVIPPGGTLSLHTTIQLNFFFALLLEILNQEQQTKSVSHYFYPSFLRLLVSLSVPVCCVLLCFSFSSPCCLSAPAALPLPLPLPNTLIQAHPRRESSSLGAELHSGVRCASAFKRQVIEVTLYRCCSFRLDTRTLESNVCATAQ